MQAYIAVRLIQRHPPPEEQKRKENAKFSRNLYADG